jgi:hypothetical protein
MLFVLITSLNIRQFDGVGILFFLKKKTDGDVVNI